MVGTIFSGLAGQALAVAVGYQVYATTRDTLALGYLGLAEAIPSLTLALIGGHVADRGDRRRIVLLCGMVSVMCALLFSGLSFIDRTPPVYLMYGIVFVAGLARGFRNPAASAFEAQVVPREHVVNASAWSSSLWHIAAVVGPAAAGLTYKRIGPEWVYFAVAVLQMASLASVFLLRPNMIRAYDPAPRIPLGESIREGLAFVWSRKPLLGSMALDLFAVLFGGAIALLPAFADDVLKVGPEGLGFLQAAPAAGALLVMLWTTRRPPVARAGRNLLLNVGGFGVTMIVFALSRNLWLSCAALFFSGVFDGVSMVIRGAILRLLTPDHIRGRVSAVSWLFIGSSNELGALESGFAAKWLGLTRSVWMGGVVTLGVVATVAAKIPALRELRLDPKREGA